MDAPVILIVDDDPAVLGSLGFMLEAEGYAVLSYGDIGELLSAEIPHLHCAILDFWMPVMNGFDVLRWLREKRIDAPAILITGRFDASLRERALACGFAKVVEKPLLANVLSDEVRHLMAAAESKGDGA